jgi:hypothetical protein
VVQTTIIPGRGVSFAKIRLYSPTSNVLCDGLHTLNLRAVDGSARGKGASLTCLLQLSKNDADDLKGRGSEVDGTFTFRTSLKKVLTTEPALGNNSSRGLALHQRWSGSRVVRFESDGRWSESA